MNTEEIETLQLKGMLASRDTMLARAKARPVKSKSVGGITPEHIELALAWANDQISYSQVLYGLFGNKKSTMQAYVILSRSLREAIRKGILKTP